MNTDLHGNPLPEPAQAPLDILGNVLSPGQAGPIREFGILKMRDGSGPAVITISGFLSQDNQDARDWTEALSGRFPENPHYHVNWEAGTRVEMLWRMMAGPLPVLGARELWEKAVQRAAITGNLLADLISRTHSDHELILIGHSLGARVIHWLLRSMTARQSATAIRDVLLLGGAVSRSDPRAWRHAAAAVEGRIINCYSTNDDVLRFLYQAATFLNHSPIGLGPIEPDHGKISNFDATALVGGHMEFKSKLDTLLRQVF